MNILQINTMDIKGGAAKIAYCLKTEAEKLGHKVSYFVKIKNSSDSEVFIIESNSIWSPWLTKISGKDMGPYLNRQIHRILATDIDFFNSDSILESDEFKKADIVHCHNLHGNYFKLSTLKKISKLKPVIWTFHDMWPITAHCAHSYNCPVNDGFFKCPSLNDYQELLWHNESYLERKKRKIYANSNFKIVLPCYWLKNKVDQTILKNKETSLIHNGIDTSIFTKSDKNKCRKELGLPFDKKIILFISIGKKKTSVKGSKYLLEMASFFMSDPSIIFLSIGGAKYGIGSPNIIEAEYISDDETLAKYYSASDIFLFPSLAETFPLTILEAMSTGLPIVSFDVGGVKEALVHKANGYIAKYGDSEDLIRGIKYFFSRKDDELEMMSDNSKRRVRELFSKERMVSEYIKLYNNSIRDFRNIG